MSRRADSPRGLDAAAIAAMLADRIEALAGKLLPAGHREGPEWVEAHRAAGGRGDGLRVHLRGAKAGVWAHFGEGADRSAGTTGDALDLVAYIECGGDRRAAVKWAAAWLGVEGEQPSAVSRQPSAKQDRRAKEGSENENRGRALQLWRGSEERLKGTPAAAYLAGRGIDLANLKDSQGRARQPRALRFHRACWNRESDKFWPTLLAAHLDPAGRFAGVHRTWLAIDSRQPSAVSKAPLADPKMTLGRCWGGAIRLWRGASGRPLGQAEPGETVAICEGIEDGLTVAIAKPELRVLAAVSLGNMANIVLPPAVRTVLICADNDGANKAAKKAIQRAVEAYHGQGRKVLIARPPEGVHDFNDLLLKPSAVSHQPSAIRDMKAEAG